MSKEKGGGDRESEGDRLKLRDWFACFLWRTLLFYILILIPRLYRSLNKQFKICFNCVSLIKF